MVKRARRLVTGHSQIARICGATSSPHDLQPHSPRMSSALWAECRSSKALHALFETLRAGHFDAQRVAEQLCAEKRIAPDSRVADNLRRCVLHFRGVSDIVHELKRRVATPFDHADARHEAWLQRLWDDLLPGVQRAGGRYSKDWGRIGFQQSDPASDFRGAGVFALQQLAYMASARQRVARRMISQPAEEDRRYPWACVGINITVEAVRIVESRRIDRMLYGKGVEEGIHVVHELYCDMFEILHARWMEEGAANLLAFPNVWKSYVKAIDDEIDRTGMLVPPGTSA